jgi:predicted secreted protein
MAGRIGRKVRFHFGGISPADEIPGVREKGVELNGEPIDVTSDENDGVRILLDNISAQDEVNVTVSGVTKDTRMKQAWIDRLRTQTVLLQYPDLSSLSGTFYLSSYSETEPYNDASTFEATLMSSGVVTYTPAP